MRRSEVERCEVVASMPAAPSSGANQSDELRLGKYRCKRRDLQLNLGWFVPHEHRHSLLRWVHESDLWFCSCRWRHDVECVVKVLRSLISIKCQSPCFSFCVTVLDDGVVSSRSLCVDATDVRPAQEIRQSGRHAIAICARLDGKIAVGNCGKCIVSYR